jgi:hypothetical protein
MLSHYIVVNGAEAIVQRQGDLLGFYPGSRHNAHKFTSKELADAVAQANTDDYHAFTVMEVHKPDKQELSMQWKPIATLDLTKRVAVAVRGGRMVGDQTLTQQNIDSGEYAFSFEFPFVIAVPCPYRSFDQSAAEWVTKYALRFCNYQGGYYAAYDGATEWASLG